MCQVQEPVDPGVLGRCWDVQFVELADDPPKGMKIDPLGAFLPGDVGHLEETIIQELGVGHMGKGGIEGLEEALACRIIRAAAEVGGYFSDDAILAF